MLKKVERGGKVQGVKIFHDAPRVNHLLFVGDSLILMRTRACNAQDLKYILEVYEQVSGQVINKDKSSIMFSPNTKQQVRDRMRVDLSIQSEAKSELYLGLPILVGRSRNNAFGYIKKKI